MEAGRQVDALIPLVELLVESADSVARDHILLEAALTTGAARAACLWRAVAGGPAPDWRPVLARGDAELLPERGAVAAVAAGELSPELPGGRQVLLDGQGPPSCALALGGVGAEDAVDLLEALLTTATLVSGAGTPGRVDLLGTLSAPLPREDGADRKLRHDLRNLLTSIRATQDLLTHYVADLERDEVRRFEGVLEQSYRSAADLLAGALRGDATAPVPTGGPTRRARCRPSAVVRTAAAVETPVLMVAGVELSLTVEDGLEEVHCPLAARDLGRVLSNLLVNARQSLTAHPVEAPEIAVELGRVTDRPDRLRLAVLDNGAGIDPADRDRVFEEGFTRGKPEGTGTGLATVRELVTAAGGRVEAGPGPAGGACLLVELPLLAGPE